MGPGLDAVPSMDRMQVSDSTHRAGLQLRSAAGQVSRTNTHTGPGWFCKNSTYHSKTPLVLQSQNIEQNTPGRVGFAKTVHSIQKRHWFCNRRTSSNAHRAGLQL
jgi:hypothetical protein